MLDKIRKLFGSESTSSEDSISKAAPAEPRPKPLKPVSMIFVDAVIGISPDASIQDFFDTFEVDIDRKFAVDKSEAHINPHASGELYLSAQFWGFPDASYADLKVLFAGSSDYKLINAIFEFYSRIPINGKPLLYFELSSDEREKYDRFHLGLVVLDALREQQECEEVAA